jgi:hypothetical protein
LVEKAKTLGFTDPEAIESYRAGYRQGQLVGNGRRLSILQGGDSVDALSEAFSSGYQNAYLVGTRIEQSVPLKKSALEKEARGLQYSSQESTNAYVTGYHAGLNAGEAKRMSRFIARAYERGYLDGYATEGDSSQKDARLSEKARARGYVDKEAAKAYSTGYRAGSRGRGAKQLRTDEDAASRAASDSDVFGRGFQLGFIVGAEEKSQDARLSDSEMGRVAEALGYNDKESMDIFCAGFRAGISAGQARSAARSNGFCFELDCCDLGSALCCGAAEAVDFSDSIPSALDSVAKVYNQGFEDGYAFGLAEVDGNDQAKASLTRPKLEAKARALGYVDTEMIDAYSTGFWDGFVAVRGSGGGEGGKFLETLCDVHQCGSASCAICRNRNWPRFVSVPQHELSDTSSSDGNLQTI